MRARLGDGRATARLVTLAVLHASLTFYLCKVGWWWHLPHKVFTVGLGDSPGGVSAQPAPASVGCVGVIHGWPLSLQSGGKHSQGGRSDLGSWGCKADSLASLLRLEGAPPPDAASPLLAGFPRYVERWQCPCPHCSLSRAHHRGCLVRARTCPVCGCPQGWRSASCG